MSLTIPARDVKPGDTIPALGGLRVALNADSNVAGERALYFGPADPSKSDGAVYLQADTLVTIARPDPDAALIERMAQAIHAADHTNGAWDEYTDDEREDYLALARAALAVVRADQ